MKCQVDDNKVDMRGLMKIQGCQQMGSDGRSVGTKFGQGAGNQVYSQGY